MFQLVFLRANACRLVSVYFSCVCGLMNEAAIQTREVVNVARIGGRVAWLYAELRVDRVGAGSVASNSRQ